MAARLTDQQKKKMIEDYAELGSYRAAARASGVSHDTARRVVQADPETAQRVQEARERNTADILAHMEARREQVCGIIDAGLEVLPEKIAGARSASDITSALGSLIDRFTAGPDRGRDPRLYELPARVLGRDFVDINREIVPNKAYIFKGGRGSLKSSFVSMKILELLKNNPLLHACVVRKVGATLKDSVYAQFQWAVGILGLEEEFRFAKSPLEITCRRTGQKIYFRGVDDPVKLKGIKPPFGYVGILWKEEADQLAGPNEERSVNQSVLRGGPESYDFMSYNPPHSRSSWVNRASMKAASSTPRRSGWGRSSSTTPPS